MGVGVGMGRVGGYKSLSCPEVLSPIVTFSLCFLSLACSVLFLLQLLPLSSSRTSSNSSFFFFFCILLKKIPLNSSDCFSRAGRERTLAGVCIQIAALKRTWSHSCLSSGAPWGKPSRYFAKDRNCSSTALVMWTRDDWRREERRDTRAAVCPGWTLGATPLFNWNWQIWWTHLCARSTCNTVFFWNEMSCCSYGSIFTVAMAPLRQSKQWQDPHVTCRSIKNLVFQLS